MPPPKRYTRFTVGADEDVGPNGVVDPAYESCRPCAGSHTSSRTLLQPQPVSAQLTLELVYIYGGVGIVVGDKSSNRRKITKDSPAIKKPGGNPGHTAAASAVEDNTPSSV